MVKELLGSDVAIKLAYMPQVIIYNANVKTVKAISDVAFLCFLKCIIRKLPSIKKTGVTIINNQLLVLNSGKFCAFVRLTGKAKYKILIMIFSNKKTILPARTATRF